MNLLYRDGRSSGIRKVLLFIILFAIVAILLYLRDVHEQKQDVLRTVAEVENRADASNASQNALFKAIQTRSLRSSGCTFQNQFLSLPSSVETFALYGDIVFVLSKLRDNKQEIAILDLCCKPIVNVDSAVTQKGAMITNTTSTENDAHSQNGDDTKRVDNAPEHAENASTHLQPASGANKGTCRPTKIVIQVQEDLS